jgi:hypothetical protein
MYNVVELGKRAFDNIVDPILEWVIEGFNIADYDLKSLKISDCPESNEILIEFEVQYGPCTFECETDNPYKFETKMETADILSSFGAFVNKDDLSVKIESYWEPVGLDYIMSAITLRDDSSRLLSEDDFSEEYLQECIVDLCNNIYDSFGRFGTAIHSIDICSKGMEDCLNTQIKDDTLKYESLDSFVRFLGSKRDYRYFLIKDKCKDIDEYDLKVIVARVKDK